MVLTNGSKVRHQLDEGVATGCWVDLGNSRCDERGEVAATSLRAVLMSPEAQEKHGPRLRLRRARVTGPLDLVGCTCTVGLEFDDCEFEGPLDLGEARLPSLHLSHCDGIPEIRAAQVQVTGDVRFVDVRCASRVTLSAAKIGGGLDCVDAELVGDGEAALDCDRITIGESFRLTGRDRRTILRSALLLRNACIQANLECHAQLEHASEKCLDARLATIKGDVLLERGFAAAGTVDLSGAHVGGRLHLGRGDIKRGVNQKQAVVAHCIDVAEDIDVDEGVTIDGPLDLSFAKVRAQLSVRDTTIRTGGRHALDGEGATVQGDVAIRGDVDIDGSVDFIGATIGGDFECSNATVRGFDGRAVMLQRAKVGGSLYLDKLIASGELTLGATDIALNVDLGGSTFGNGGNRAVAAVGAKVGKDVYMNRDFKAKGMVDLTRAHLGGSLVIEDATLGSSNGTSLCLKGATMEGVLRLCPSSAPDGVVDLLDARAAVLDDRSATWSDKMVLDGFQYDRLDPKAPSDVPSRLEWLGRNRSGYSSRLYAPLIQMLRSSGAEDDARKVELARASARVRNAPRAVQWLYRPLGLTVGYGYATRRILYWLAVLLAVGTVVFWATEHYTSEFQARDSKAPPTTFNPFFYTLDLLIPVVGLGLRGTWVTSGVAMYLTWIFTITGWLLAAVLVAGLSQLVRKT